MRNVGQTSLISVSMPQHAHWFTFLYPRSDWMSSGRGQTGGQGIEGFTWFRTRTSLTGAGLYKAGFGTCTFVSSSLD